MGRLRFGHDWDWRGAEEDFRRALDIDPNDLDAHFFSAMLFMALGRFSESIAHIERAEQLDPLSSTVHSAFGRVLYRGRKFDQAIPHLNQAIALEPRSSDDMAGWRTSTRRWAGMTRHLHSTKKCTFYEVGRCGVRISQSSSLGWANETRRTECSPLSDHQPARTVGPSIRSAWQQRRGLPPSLQARGRTERFELREDGASIRQPPCGPTMAVIAPSHELPGRQRTGHHRQTGTGSSVMRPTSTTWRTRAGDPIMPSIAERGVETIPHLMHLYARYSTQLTSPRSSGSWRLPGKLRDGVERCTEFQHKNSPAQRVHT